MGINAIELYEACKKLVAEYDLLGKSFLELMNSWDPGIQAIV
jgi:hypothetical protein